MRARDGTHCAFEIVGQQFELTGGHREPARVADGPLTVHDDDDAVLAVQQFVDQGVHALHVEAESLAQRHVQVSAGVDVASSVFNEAFTFLTPAAHGGAPPTPPW